MSDLEQVVSSEPVQDNPLMAQSEEQLQQAFREEQSKLTAQNTAAPQGQVAQTPSTAVEGQVSGQQTEGLPQTQGQEPQKVESTEGKPTFQELQEKTGVKTPDALAANFIELQRAFTKSQAELSQIRRQPDIQAPVSPQPQAQVPTAPPVDPNSAFIEHLSRDPIGAIAAVTRIIAQGETQDLRTQYKENQLRNEITSLGTSPTTSSVINSPAVQEEMTAMFKTNPALLSPGKFTETFYTALGKVALKNMAKTVNANPVAGQPTFMEGRAKPVAVVNKSPDQMSTDELAAEISKIQATL